MDHGLIKGRCNLANKIYPQPPSKEPMAWMDNLAGAEIGLFSLF
jgi:hypothetical protein